MKVMPAEVAFSVLALDPSTEQTGVALVQFDRRGCPVSCVTAALSSPCRKAGLAARYQRIRDIREALVLFVYRHPVALDCIAYEKPFTRGLSATGAIHQAIGAYLCLSVFEGLPVCEVNTQTLKAVAGLGGIRAKAKDAADKARRRQEGKRATILWANARFGLDMTESQDAEADALACSVAAFQAHLRQAQAVIRLPRPRLSPIKKVGKV